MHLIRYKSNGNVCVYIVDSVFLKFFQMYNYFEDSNYVYFVLELCHNGEFQRYLRMRGNGLNESEARKVMQQVVEGVLYLHSHGILHRDLTLSNLLLTHDMNTVSYTTGNKAVEKSFIIYILYRHTVLTKILLF